MRPTRTRRAFRTRSTSVARARQLSWRRVARAANAFLSGPLTIGEGVTLLVDKGVTLFASRDPKDYDVNGPGTCGTMPAKGPCKAFITIRAKNVGIMGDGVINGRGGAKMLGQDLSWWGLAVKAETASGGNQGAPYSDPRLISASNADGFTMYRITLHDSPNFHVGVTPDGWIYGVGRSSEDADA